MTRSWPPSFSFLAGFSLFFVCPSLDIALSGNRTKVPFRRVFCFNHYSVPAKPTFSQWKVSTTNIVVCNWTSSVTIEVICHTLSTNYSNQYWAIKVDPSKLSCLKSHFFTVGRYCKFNTDCQTGLVRMDGIHKALLLKRATTLFFSTAF